MFEVEQNFNLSDEERIRILSNAEFVNEKTFTDVYYDTSSRALSLQDRWLRSRDGRYEVKLPSGMEAGSIVDQYQEIEDEAGVRAALGLSSAGSFEARMAAAGYAPFCTCTTARRTFRDGDFTIVLDHVAYAGCGWTFDTCEVELLVDAAEKMSQAASRIADFAKSRGLRTEYLHGKVLEYLRRERPEHFGALVKAGVVLAPSG